MSARPCPICGKPATELFRPFCSSRCADVDLNRWLTGAYSIDDEDQLAEDDASPPDEKP
jgi:hypothetical protein